MLGEVEMAMSDTERLARMERRQEALIAGISGLVDIMQMNTAMLTELMEWLKQPPSSELPDLLQALVATIHEMREEIRVLPARVARAVVDGELDGRG
jgi:hypothetical protein